jgi:hypothetical protein
MVNPQGTSFIPQRPARGKSQPRQVRKIYVLAYIAYVMFFGSLIAAGVVLFYQFSLGVHLDEKRTQLEQERQQFNQGDIESVRDLERRLKVAQERLNKHVSVLAIFEALERSTVRSLRYVSFSYQRLNDSFPLLTFSGTSERFNNVLFQREVLASNPILAGSSFSEVQLQSSVNAQNPSVVTETIAFTLQKSLDTSLIGYTPRSNMQGQSASEEIPITFGSQMVDPQTSVLGQQEDLQ